MQMRHIYRHIGWLTGCMLMLLLAVGCSSGSEDAESPLPKEKPVLKVYVFAPEKPIVTRADIGNVDASAEEAAINTLDVWVFETGTTTLVGHVHQSNISWDGQKEVAINVSDDFASRKPNVDIYVAANADAAGLALGATSTASALESAIIASDYFGLTSPVSSVPVEGLPMSGLLKDQAVTDTSPVYAVTPRVKLVRAVSKVRFIFTKSVSVANDESLKVNSISLNGGVLPKQEYLFNSSDNVVADNYETAAATLVSEVSGDAINSCDNPSIYIYKVEQTGQEYENKINDGLEEHVVEDVTTPAALSELGRFYLRESDKKLAGTISFTSEGTAKSTTFEMAEAGDFSRNHTWIVYAYFLGGGELKVNVVNVKSWTAQDGTHAIYNW